MPPQGWNDILGDLSPVSPEHQAYQDQEKQRKLLQDFTPVQISPRDAARDLARTNSGRSENSMVEQVFDHDKNERRYLDYNVDDKFEVPFGEFFFRLGGGDHAVSAGTADQALSIDGYQSTGFELTHGKDSEIPITREEYEEEYRLASDELRKNYPGMEVDVEDYIEWRKMYALAKGVLNAGERAQDIYGPILTSLNSGQEDRLQQAMYEIQEGGEKKKERGYLSSMKERFARGSSVIPESAEGVHELYEEQTPLAREEEQFIDRVEGLRRGYDPAEGGGFISEGILKAVEIVPAMVPAAFMKAPAAASYWFGLSTGSANKSLKDMGMSHEDRRLWAPMIGAPVAALEYIGFKGLEEAAGMKEVIKAGIEKAGFDTLKQFGKSFARGYIRETGTEIAQSLLESGAQVIANEMGKLEPGIENSEIMGDMLEEWKSIAHGMLFLSGGFAAVSTRQQKNLYDQIAAEANAEQGQENVTLTPDIHGVPEDVEMTMERWMESETLRGYVEQDEELSGQIEETLKNNKTSRKDFDKISLPDGSTLGDHYRSKSQRDQLAAAYWNDSEMPTVFRRGEIPQDRIGSEGQVIKPEQLIGGDVGQQEAVDPVDPVDTVDPTDPKTIDEQPLTPSPKAQEVIDSGHDPDLIPNGVPDWFIPAEDAEVQSEIERLSEFEINKDDDNPYLLKNDTNENLQMNLGSTYAPMRDSAERGDSNANSQAKAILIEREIQRRKDEGTWTLKQDEEKAQRKQREEAKKEAERIRERRKLIQRIGRQAREEGIEEDGLLDYFVEQLAIEEGFESNQDQIDNLKKMYREDSAKKNRYLQDDIKHLQKSWEGETVSEVEPEIAEVKSVEDQPKPVTEEQASEMYKAILNQNAKGIAKRYGSTKKNLLGLSDQYKKYFIEGFRDFQEGKDPSRKYSGAIGDIYKLGYDLPERGPVIGEPGGDRDDDEMGRVSSIKSMLRSGNKRRKIKGIKKSDIDLIPKNILLEMDKRIREAKPDGGQAAAINEAFQVAREYVEKSKKAKEKKNVGKKAPVELPENVNLTKPVAYEITKETLDDDTLTGYDGKTRAVHVEPSFKTDKTGIISMSPGAEWFKNIKLNPKETIKSLLVVSKKESRRERIPEFLYNPVFVLEKEQYQTGKDKKRDGGKFEGTDFEHSDPVKRSPSARTGMELVYRDGITLRIDAASLIPASILKNMKEGDLVRINLESFGKKPITQKGVVKAILEDVGLKASTTKDEGFVKALSKSGKKAEVRYKDGKWVVEKDGGVYGLQRMIDDTNWETKGGDQEQVAAESRPDPEPSPKVVEPEQAAKDPVPKELKGFSRNEDGLLEAELVEEQKIGTNKFTIMELAEEDPLGNYKLIYPGGAADNYNTYSEINKAVQRVLKEHGLTLKGVPKKQEKPTTDVPVEEKTTPKKDPIDYFQYVNDNKRVARDSKGGEYEIYTLPKEDPLGTYQLATPSGGLETFKTLDALKEKLQSDLDRSKRSLVDAEAPVTKKEPVDEDKANSLERVKEAIEKAAEKGVTELSLIEVDDDGNIVFFGSLQTESDASTYAERLVQEKDQLQILSEDLEKAAEENPPTWKQIENIAKNSDTYYRLNAQDLKLDSEDKSPLEAATYNVNKRMESLDSEIGVWEKISDYLVTEGQEKLRGGRREESQEGVVDDIRDFIDRLERVHEIRGKLLRVKPRLGAGFRDDLFQDNIDSFIDDLEGDMKILIDMLEVVSSETGVDLTPDMRTKLSHSSYLQYAGIAGTHEGTRDGLERKIRETKLDKQFEIDVIKEYKEFLKDGYWKPIQSIAPEELLAQESFSYENVLRRYDYLFKDTVRKESKSGKDISVTTTKATVGIADDIEETLNKHAGYQHKVFEKEYELRSAKSQASRIINSENHSHMFEGEANIYIAHVKNGKYKIIVVYDPTRTPENIEKEKKEAQDQLQKDQPIKISRELLEVVNKELERSIAEHDYERKSPRTLRLKEYLENLLKEKGEYLEIDDSLDLISYMESAIPYRSRVPIELLEESEEIRKSLKDRERRMKDAGVEKSTSSFVYVISTEMKDEFGDAWELERRPNSAGGETHYIETEDVAGMAEKIEELVKEYPEYQIVPIGKGASYKKIGSAKAAATRALKSEAMIKHFTHGSVIFVARTNNDTWRAFIVTDVFNRKKPKGEGPGPKTMPAAPMVVRREDLERRTRRREDAERIQELARKNAESYRDQVLSDSEIEQKAKDVGVLEDGESLRDIPEAMSQGQLSEEGKKDLLYRIAMMEILGTENTIITTVERTKESAKKKGKTGWSYLKSVLKRIGVKVFTPSGMGKKGKGLIPIKEQTEGWQKQWMMKFHQSLKEVNEAIKEVWGKDYKNLDPGEIQVLNAASVDSAAMDKLPDKIREPWQKIRNAIDSLSKSIVQSGQVSDKLALVIDSNLGEYVMITYDMWSSRDHYDMIMYSEKGKEIQEKAIKAIQNQVYEDSVKRAIAHMARTIFNVKPVEEVGQQQHEMQKKYRNMASKYRRKVNKQIESLKEELKKEIEDLKSKGKSPSDFNVKTWSGYASRALRLRYGAKSWKDYSKKAMKKFRLDVTEKDFGDRIRQDVQPPTEGEASTLMEAIISPQRTEQGSGTMSPGSARAHRKNLIARKAISESIQAVMGIQRDPMQAVINTVETQTHMVSRIMFHRMVKEWANSMGKSGFPVLWSREEVDEMDSEEMADIGLREFKGKEWTVLEGMYTDEDTYDMISRIFTNPYQRMQNFTHDNLGTFWGTAFTIITKAGALAKLFKVVYSTLANNRNIVEAGFNAVSQGAAGVGRFLDSVVLSDAMQESGNNGNKVMKAVLSPLQFAASVTAKLSGRQIDEKVRTRLREWIRYGLSVGGAEMKELEDLVVKDAYKSSSDVIIENMPDIAKTKRLGRKIEGSVDFFLDNKVQRTARAIYTGPDDMFKFYIAESEYRMLVNNEIQEGRIKDGESVPAGLHRKLMKEAVDRANNFTTTRERAYGGVKTISAIPVMASFPTFFGEKIRTRVETFKTIREDLKSGEKIRVSWAKRKMLLTAASLAGTVAFAKAITSMFYDDEEQEGLRNMLPPYRRNNVIMWYKVGDEHAYIDLSNTFSDLWFWQPFIASLNTKPGEDFATNFMGELMLPFTDKDILWDRIFDIVNPEETRVPGYNPLDPIHKRTWANMRHVMWGDEYDGPLMPYMITHLMRFKRAVMEEPNRYGELYDFDMEVISAFSGMRWYKIEGKRALSFFAKDFRYTWNGIREPVLDEATSYATTSISNLEDELSSFQIRRKKLYSEAHKAVRTIINTMKVPPVEVRRVLKSEGFSQDDIRHIMRGTVRPYRVSGETEKRILKTPNGRKKVQLIKQYGR